MTEIVNEAGAPWALVEIMGHSRVIGRVSESEQYGGRFVRVDIPATETVAAQTRLYGAAAIFSIRFLSEEVALKMLAAIVEPPVTAWEMQRTPALLGRATMDDDEEFDE